MTAWNHYDTIYTERYMWIPQENKEGYEAGSAMKYAKDLKGRLLIYYGTADNNVHPSNSMQLIDALMKAGKSFDVQVGPDLGHSGVNQSRMMEFFLEHLVVQGPGGVLDAVSGRLSCLLAGPGALESRTRLGAGSPRPVLLLAPVSSAASRA